MSEGILKSQDVLIEHAQRVCDLFGLSDGMGRIAALFYLSPGPVSIQEICKRLELTKGTVSLYLRMLEERKVLVRAFVAKAGREKYYEINPTLWSDLRESLLEIVNKRATIVREAVDKCAALLAPCQAATDDAAANQARLLGKRLEALAEVNEISLRLLTGICAAAPQDPNG